MRLSDDATSNGHRRTSHETRRVTQLKKHYASHEVAELTGLTARQLQWWDTHRLFRPAVGTQRTEAGGFTRRRYTPMDVLELQVLADLRRRGFSLPMLRRLLSTLHEVFGVRLFEALGEGGPLTLFIDGERIFARTTDGHYFNLTDDPTQPLLVVGDGLHLRELRVRRRTSEGRRMKAESGRGQKVEG